MAKTYEHLDIWKKAVDLATVIYRTTANFPNHELFGLTSQLRRAVVSISANIAEGSGRGSKKDFRRFVDIAMGSLNEVESLLCIAEQLGYLDKRKSSSIQDEVVELGKLLGGFRKYLGK